MPNKNDAEHEKQERQWKWGKRVIRNMVEVLIYAMQLGADISAEHPTSASSWRSCAAMRELWEQLFWTTTSCCSWNAREEEGGLLLRGSMRVVSTSQKLVDRLRRTCQGNHDHSESDVYDMKD